jgi:hypothetical protein
MQGATTPHPVFACLEVPNNIVNEVVSCKTAVLSNDNFLKLADSKPWID